MIWRCVPACAAIGLILFSIKSKIDIKKTALRACLPDYSELLLESGYNLLRRLISKPSWPVHQRNFIATHRAVIHGLLITAIGLPTASSFFLEFIRICI